MQTLHVRVLSSVPTNVVEKMQDKHYWSKYNKILGFTLSSLNKKTGFNEFHGNLWQRIK